MTTIQISIEDVRPGMVLAADVSIQGATLLNKDTLLDESLIALLRSCEITSLSVIDNQNAPPGTDNARPGTPTSRQNGPLPVKNVSSSVPADRMRTTDGFPASPKPPSTPARSRPQISVIVAPDEMAAQLVVEPHDETPGELELAMLVNALTENGVVFGIDETALAALVDNWKKAQHRYECGTAARGTPAIPAEEGTPQMTLRHLSRRCDVDEVRACRRFGEAATKLPPIDRVAAGSVVAEKQLEHPAVPGKNIRGLPVFNEVTIRHEPILETNVVMSPDNRTILAQVDGIAYHIDGAIGVVPIEFDGQLDIIIAPDRMSASCSIMPPGPGGTLPGITELRLILSDKGVCSGIQDADIDTLSALCSRGAYPAEPFVIARGIPPVNGTNGSCTYHFNTQTSLSPAIGKDGHADFKSMNIVNSVTAGQELVTLVPPGAGHEGCNILGQRLPPEPGVPAKLPQGAQTVPDAENPAILRAATDGIVRFAGGLVEVCEGFIVPANVDFSIGNINYSKTVIVSGDIKAGFDVHCGGDLQVSGTIEDSHITVGGNVLCKFGFVGQGKGIIDAKGDVNIGFMKNQTVRAFKNVTIAKEALNSTVLSRGAVMVHGNPLSVAGGTVRAKSSITVYSVGNHTGIRTLLEAGVDYLVADELAMIDEQCKTAAAHCHQCTESLLRFQKTLQGRKQLSAFEQKKITDLAAAIRQARQQQSVLDERKAIVAAKQYHLTDAFIRIEHAAYTGTLLKFGDRHYLIKEEIAGPKTVRYIDHEIKVL